MTASVFHVLWELRVRPGRQAEFEERYGDDYAALDARCAELTLEERPLGEFESL